MRYTILALLVLCMWSSLAFASSAEEYKLKYRGVTYGELQLNTDVEKQMFYEFNQVFKGKEPSEVEDFDTRFAIFREKLQKIIAHNRDSSKAWKMGINEYSDMTDDEFKDHFRFEHGDEQKCSATGSGSLNYVGDLPTHKDWRDEGKVTPVKNQGKCGSCWTFSTVGAMESHALIGRKSSPIPTFSEQQLVDCAGDYDCHGCSGGLPSYAFNYIRDHGMTTEELYPYQAVDQTCTYNSNMARVTTAGPHNITAGDEIELHYALAFAGPVSVAFQVVGDFRDYESGVYNSTDCKNGPMNVNHAVLAVGYGTNTTSGLPYYTIKNSWGNTWGNSGYFDIQSGVNMCGIAVCNSFPRDVVWTPSSISSFMHSA
jgi:cathepsin H